MSTLLLRGPTGPIVKASYPIGNGPAHKVLEWHFVSIGGKQALYAFGPHQPDGFALMLWIVAEHRKRFALFVGEERPPTYFTTARSAQDAAFAAAFAPTGGSQ